MKRPISPIAPQPKSFTNLICSSISTCEKNDEVQIITMPKSRSTLSTFCRTASVSVLRAMVRMR